MYITRETDYAVRIAIYLAQQDSKIGASKISDANGIPSRFTLKILRKLMEGGIVKSYMGSRGGYELALEPKDISLLQIIEMVEGTYRFSRCIDAENNCCSQHSSSSCCKPHKIYSEVTNMVREKLKEQTLDKLI